MSFLNLLRVVLPALLSAALLSACGGGGSDPIAGPGDPPTGGGGSGAQGCDADGNDGCGVGYITLTDADGDVLSYTVDVVSLALERANGDVVETLPATTRVDFADYVELSELLAAPRLLPGEYVRGTITLDFSDAEVIVERSGEAVLAEVVDVQGQPIAQTTLDVELSEGSSLRVSAGRRALLALDFDLEASNEVDLQASPPLVTVQPVVLAELVPVEEKELRVRGALQAVAPADGEFRIDLRPYSRRDGRFGEVSVRVTDETSYDVDGEILTGNAGLEALAGLPDDALAVAFGTLATSENTFTADTVLAGDSVPGITDDTVLGTVVARSGDLLTVRGASVLRAGDERPEAFLETVDVTLSPTTVVQRPASPEDGLTVADISVGQRVRIFGDAAARENGGATTRPSTPLAFDAGEGRVQLLRTQLSGLVVQNQPGQLTLDLAFVNGRGAPAFDFSGTGPTVELDADPTAYEIDTGVLPADAPPGTAARVFGYVSAFGAAPPDFRAVTTVESEGLPASLRFLFDPAVAQASFASISPQGLVLNVDAFARGRIRLPGLRTPLGAPLGPPTLAPATDGRSRYAIVERGETTMFEDFATFTQALAMRLDGSRSVRSVTASGAWAPQSSLLAARSVVVVLRAGD